MVPEVCFFSLLARRRGPCFRPIRRVRLISPRLVAYGRRRKRNPRPSAPACSSAPVGGGGREWKKTTLRSPMTSGTQSVRAAPRKPASLRWNQQGRYAVLRAGGNVVHLVGSLSTPQRLPLVDAREESLDERTARPPSLPPSEIWGFWLQLCGAVDFLHSRYDSRALSSI